MIRVLLFLSLCLSANADDLIIQKNAGPNTCGPCAFVHSLYKAGNSKALNNLQGKSNLEKAVFFNKKYGSLPSITYEKKKASYSKESGIADRDLEHLINQMLKEANDKEISGRYILKKEGESSEGFVKNTISTIRSSIQKGFHPLLSVRAMAAEYSEKREKFQWNSKGGHWVAVHEISSTGKYGFTIKFSDSLTGEIKQGFISLNQNRPAVVPMSFTVDEKGKEIWKWESNKNTLQLTAPQMPLGTVRAKWNERTFLAVRYLIFRE